MLFDAVLFCCNWVVVVAVAVVVVVVVAVVVVVVSTSFAARKVDEGKLAPCSAFLLNVVATVVYIERDDSFES